MKIFSPFVKKHFAAKPHFICLTLFLACFCIILPIVFSFKIEPLGEYTYFDAAFYNKTTFYFLNPSDFSLTLFGQILLGFTQFFLNTILPLVVGVTLNIVSVHQQKSYLRHRHERDLENNGITYHALNVEVVVFATLVIPLPIKSELTPKEKRDRKVEKRMFYMALTLCTIAIVSRGLLMIKYSYFFFFFNDTSFQISLALCLVFYSVFTLLPTIA